MSLNNISFNQWQNHMANELKKNYLKLKLIQDEKFHKIRHGKPSRLPRV